MNQIKQQCGKDEGDGSTRIQRNDGMGNQYDADYWKLREFVDTAINQINSSISHTGGYDEATKKRDRKFTAKGLEYQLSLLHKIKMTWGKTSQKGCSYWGFALQQQEFHHS